MSNNATELNINSIFITREEYIKPLLKEGMDEKEIDEVYPFCIATIVPENDRLDSILANSIEANIFQRFAFTYARQAIKGYDGGKWDFYTTNNGGAFMALDPEKKYEVTSTNGSTYILNGIATGYFISQMTLSQMQFSDNRKLAQFGINLYLPNEDLRFSFEKETLTKLLSLLD